MSWIQVSPTQYERPFDAIEVFYRGLADAAAPFNKQHYLISSVTRLKVLPPVEEVQQAWRNLREEQPQIAAVADDSGTRFIYTVPSPAELDVWTQETLLVEPNMPASHLLNILEPSTLFRLYYLPHSRELLWRTPHWRVDGIGLMHVQAAFFRLLSGQSTPSEPSNIITRLNPSLDDIMTPPGTMTPEEITSSINAELSIVLDNAPTTITTPTLPNILPSTTRFLHTSIPAATSTRIITTCKAHNLTITTALHATFTLALLPHIQHNYDPSTRGLPGGTYTGLNAHSLRRYLPTPYNSPSAAVSVYHTGIPFSIDLSTTRDFHSIASALGKGYARDLSAAQPRPIFPFHPQYVSTILELFLAQPEDPLRGSAVPVLSSLGRVDDYLDKEYGDVEVVDWWIGVDVVSRGLVVNVWSWRGELRLGVAWNEAFYEEGFVRDIVEGWRGRLIEELGR
ncbi:uncharacterized protein BO80DRAFT_422513 [Aspergillus ibericus CBS 121593]|uniref:Uncharacterized protein n=1 Tax=Aspergillus ibericus CBS 121593 TaxID=1448316 RepID=A0A395HAH6_9EURO|nr:hypothetical protein BO80DRAFT_422513 [Aspergillus ibericus CBS 121593]RAL04145.1 hypothetical protein BO80DRAFT_422513 [Aspergillus ibericus CBS 121593]